MFKSAQKNNDRTKTPNVINERENELLHSGEDYERTSTGGFYNLGHRHGPMTTEDYDSNADNVDLVLTSN